jgi:imidazolonepropionase-like amidohydrolase
MHTEMELLVDSGIPPASVLQAATLHNARVLQEESRLGTIAPEKLADLILLTHNPLENIRNTRSIEIVVRGGKICRPADLLKYVSP